MHDVELVMGLNTSFLTQTVTIGAPMERGQLYIATDGAQRVPRIEPPSRDCGTAQHSPVRLLLPQPPRRRGCAAGVVPLWRRRGARTLAWTVDSRRRLRRSPGLSAAPPPGISGPTGARIPPMSAARSTSTAIPRTSRPDPITPIVQAPIRATREACWLVPTATIPTVASNSEPATPHSPTMTRRLGAARLGRPRPGTPGRPIRPPPRTGAPRRTRSTTRQRIARLAASSGRRLGSRAPPRVCLPTFPSRRSDQ